MCTHTFTVQRSAQAFINYAVWPRLRQLTVARWRPSRLTPATTDERCADANIFASARNTICVSGRTQRISIQSYHRQLRDITTYKCPQLKARKRSHLPQMLSISLQFAEASVCNCKRTHVCVSVNVSAFTFTETFLSTHHCCGACAYSHFLITLPGGWREGRGEQLAVTLVLRTSSGPVRQLKLDVCTLSASSNSYNWASAINWPSRWTPVSFCHFSETGRLTSSCVEYVPPTLRGNCGKNCAYYSQIFTVFHFHTDYTLTSTQHLIIEKYIKNLKQSN